MARKYSYSIEEYFYLIACIVAILLGIFETFHIVEIISSEKAIYVILSLVALMFIYIVKDKPTIDKLRDLLIKDRVGAIGDLMNEINPDLQEVFGDVIEGNLLFFREAIQSETIHISDRSDFQKYYRVALKKHQGARFITTSLPTKKFFWSNNIQENETERAIQDFIQNGGENIRIFFLENSKDIQLAEVKDVLDFHKNVLKVKVFTVLIHEIPEYYRKRFFAIVKSTKSALAWSSETNSFGVADNFSFTSSPKVISDFDIAYNEMTTLHSFRPY